MSEGRGHKKTIRIFYNILKICRRSQLKLIHLTDYINYRKRTPMVIKESAYC